MVFEAIRQAIIEKQFAPGDPVPEHALAQQLGVSKTPVREALLRMQHTGLVTNDAGRGLRVAPVSRTRLRETYQMRAALEALAAELAAGRVTASEAKSLREIAERTVDERKAQPTDPPRYHAADTEFHQLVAEVSGNGRLAGLIDDMSVLCWVLHRRDAAEVAWSVPVAEEHVAIATAIDNRDPRRAADEMYRHVNGMRVRVLEVLESRFSNLD